MPSVYTLYILLKCLHAPEQQEEKRTTFVQNNNKSFKELFTPPTPGLQLTNNPTPQPPSQSPSAHPPPSYAYIHSLAPPDQHRNAYRHHGR
jgi:hypothetical protein